MKTATKAAIEFWAGVAFAILVAAWGVTAANAQQSAAEAGVILNIHEADENGLVGEIRHYNGYSYGFERENFFDFETPRGNFTIRLVTTPNAEDPGCTPRCPDTIEIWDWPEDIIPTALDVTTPEQGVSIIQLYEFRGV